MDPLDPYDLPFADEDADPVTVTTPTTLTYPTLTSPTSTIPAPPQSFLTLAETPGPETASKDPGQWRGPCSSEDSGPREENGAGRKNQAWFWEASEESATEDPEGKGGSNPPMPARCKEENLDDDDCGDVGGDRDDGDKDDGGDPNLNPQIVFVESKKEVYPVDMADVVVVTTDADGAVADGADDVTRGDKDDGGDPNLDPQIVSVESKKEENSYYPVDTTDAVATDDADDDVITPNDDYGGDFLTGGDAQPFISETVTGGNQTGDITAYGEQDEEDAGGVRGGVEEEEEDERDADGSSDTQQQSFAGGEGGGVGVEEEDAAAAAAVVVGTRVTQPLTQSNYQGGEPSTTQEDVTAATEETKPTETESIKQIEICEQTLAESCEQTETTSKEKVTESGEQTETDSSCVEIASAMDPQGETHGGKTAADNIDNDLVDDFFATSATSETVTNGIGEESAECVLRIEEGVDSTRSSASRSGLEKEGSPEIIIVGSVDSVENVTLKDATSEKALLGNREDDGSCSSQRDSLSSRTDEDKRLSSSDMDMDFAVLELDSSHLNLAMSKQKTSLRKRGSLARRKKPSRGSVTHMASDSSDSMFQDSTDTKASASPSSDMAEDEVFDKQFKAGETQPSKPSVTGVRKAAQPFKPSLVMPGLHDLSKSKLFNQERNKSDDSPASPAKSPQSPLSPSHRPNPPPPPQVLPKPTSKVQKDSQNKTIAAENSAHSADAKSVDTNTVSGNILITSVEDALGVPKESRSDSASSSEGPKPARSDSGSFAGPKFMRTDSWSSVSSPRPLSRRESVSSVEGGEASSPHSTPRRASIQGSAYVPMGFRPRRSSSIVLDANNKLVDLPAVSTPPSAAPPERDSEAVGSSSEVRSPAYAAPAWLSEVKAKTASASPSDASARLRTTSVGSNDGSAVSASSGRSRNSSGSGDGVHGSNPAEEGVQKKQGEDESDTPGWGVKTTTTTTTMMQHQQQQQSTSQVSENVPGKKDVEENGEEEKRPVPPWAAELKKKNRHFVSPRVSESGDTNGKMTTTTPYKGSAEKENSPVVSSGRDDYSPSWMKSGQQMKKPPPPVVPVKPIVASKPPAVKPSSSSDNPMRQYETPRWKLELAEKKKRREAEMMPTIEDNDKGESASVPQWRQQLSLRKKQQQQPAPADAVTEADDEGANAEWAKKAEERRARLMKSGLFNQAETAEES